MSDEPIQEEAEEPELPPYLIEGARSGRAKCKSCRKAIPQGSLRIGIRVEGPYGVGHMWHHLTCAAKRQFDKVEEAYAMEAWNFAKVVPTELPDLGELRELREEAEKKKSEAKAIPYAELDPSGRAKCKHCGESLEKGAPRVVVGRAVEFGQQTRTTPINVHPGCVADALQAEDSATEVDGFEAALRTNSKGLDEVVLNSVLEEVGSLF
jgi:poly(ADP-ribose) polymerase-like protein